MNYLKYLIQHSQKLPTTRVVGIDLGTTNCTVAQVSLPIPEEATAAFACECLPLEQTTQMGPFTSSLIPSIIANDKAGTTWVGEGAKRMRAEPQKHGLLLEKNLFYETKNEMGLKKTYPRAPEAFNHAHKIAGQLLQFIIKGTRKVGATPIERTVVTVPASYQLNQRADTLKAASIAGIELSDFDLLDEPVAALTDYLFTYGEGKIAKGRQNIVVFDFGGGTCDVFVAQLTPGSDQSGLNIDTKSVSRYHRLGGGDFDTAIIHNVLIPQLIKENDLSEREFGWSERKKIIEPALRGCAEALKEGICREVSQLHLHGRYESADKSTIIARQAPTRVTVGKQHYLLKAPELSAAEWESLLEPFLDTEMMHTRETDYTLALTVFAPLSDALARANIPKSEIDLVLLAGGSSLVPQVQWAMQRFFKQSSVLTFPDATAAQTAIARGAAWNAAWLETFKQPLVRPIISQTLALRVQGHAPIPLVQEGMSIPFPKEDAFEMLTGLSLPQPFSGLLRLEVVTLPDEHVVLSMPIEFPRSEGGEALNFEFRFSSGRSFDCKVALRKQPDQTHEVTLENPLINVANPGEARVKIEEIEQSLREAGGLSSKSRDTLCELANLYHELRMLDKACEVLKNAARAVGRPDAEILNRLGMFYDEAGDYNRMEVHYAEAAEYSGDWAGPLFNWALHHRRMRNFDKALEIVDKGILRSPGSGPYYILRARIILGAGDEANAREAVKEGLLHFPDVKSQTDWELGWYQDGATLIGENEKAKQAQSVRQSKGVKNSSANGGENDLPVLS